MSVYKIVIGKDMPPPNKNTSQIINIIRIFYDVDHYLSKTDKFLGDFLHSITMTNMDNSLHFNYEKTEKIK